MIHNNSPLTGKEKTIYKSFGISTLTAAKNIHYILLMVLMTIVSSCGPDDEPKVVHIDKAVFSIDDQKTFGNNLNQVFLNSPMIFKPLDRVEYSQIYGHLDQTFQILTQTINVENRDEFDWELTILEDDNRKMAFCAPGGKFFIYTGLLKYLMGEHELVALMAHEMFYSDTEKAMDALVDEFKSVPFLLGDIFLGNEIEAAKDVAEYMRDYTYTTVEVTAGDAYALDLLCPFQYNPSGLSSFVERSMASASVDWLMKRNGTENRVEELKYLQGPCGNIEDDPTFADRYAMLINTLP